MEDTTSRTEKAYIETSCAQNIRGDGREQRDIRSMSVELDILPQCNSSCRLCIGSGTDLICSVKVFANFPRSAHPNLIGTRQLEVSEPLALSPTEGILEVTAEFSPSINLRTDKRRLQMCGGRIAGQLQEYVLNAVLFPDR